VVKLTIGPLGETSLEVDGMSVPYVRHVAVSASPGDLSRLWLELVAPEGIEIDMDPSLIFYGYGFDEI
jgi:hypothetical protein